MPQNLSKAQTCCFFCGGIVAVFGGEVDALDSSIQGDNQYLELKTSRVIESQRQEQNFKRSVFMLWCLALILLLGFALSSLPANCPCSVLFLSSCYLSLFYSSLSDNCPCSSLLFLRLVLVLVFLLIVLVLFFSSCYLSLFSSSLPDNCPCSVLLFPLLVLVLFFSS